MVKRFKVALIGVAIAMGIVLFLVIDFDGDGLSNFAELQNGTSMFNSDTDGDGLGDYQEMNTYGTNPLLSDTDDDGLSDGAEVNVYKTNPMITDTDNDNLNDGVEAHLGTNPLAPEYLSVNCVQRGADLVVFGETSLPDGFKLEVSIPSLAVSDFCTAENHLYEWKLQRSVNASSETIQISIACPSQNFKNNTSSTSVSWIRVNNPPTPSFTYTRDGRTVKFLDNSLDNDGSIMYWEWEFGTGEGDNSPSPIHTYASRGFYEVELTVTDNAGAKVTYTETIAVSDTFSYTWTYGGRSQNQTLEIVDEVDRYEYMSHVVYLYYDITPIGAYLSEDAKKFVTPGDEKIKAFAENLKANYLTYYSMSEEGLANFVLRFVQEAIPYYEPGVRDNLYQWSYALEILVAKKGNCTDKSILYATLLEALGYQTALIDFETDKHMMVGVHLGGVPTMASSAGYLNKTVGSFTKNNVVYWPAETTCTDWNVGERESSLHTLSRDMYILPLT